MIIIFASLSLAFVLMLIGSVHVLSEGQTPWHKSKCLSKRTWDPKLVNLPWFLFTTQKLAGPGVWVSKFAFIEGAKELPGVMVVERVHREGSYPLRLTGLRHASVCFIRAGAGIFSRSFSGFLVWIGEWTVESLPFLLKTKRQSPRTTN